MSMWKCDSHGGHGFRSDCTECKRIGEIKAENTHLKHSLGLCHYYAGCAADVCELDGDMCTGQTVKPKEFLDK